MSLINLNQNCLHSILIFKINTIYISMIGDNEDKNKRLDDYQRHEIMLFYFNGFNSSVNWKKFRIIRKRYYYF